MKKTEVYHGLIILFFFAVGIIGHIWTRSLNLMLILTPWILLIFGLSVLVPVIFKGKKQIILWCIISYLLTFTAEVIGVKTGLVFGAYTYGQTLGIKLFEVPLVIGFNWVIVILGAVGISQAVFSSKIAASVLSGAIALGFDAVMEPTAIKLNYWSWSAENMVKIGRVPLQNFIAWFVIAFIFAFGLLSLKERLESKMPSIYLGIQSVFFILLLFTL